MHGHAPTESARFPSSETPHSGHLFELGILISGFSSQQRFERHSPTSARQVHRTEPSIFRHVSQASAIPIPRSRKEFLALLLAQPHLCTHLRESQAVQMQTVLGETSADAFGCRHQAHTSAAVCRRSSMNFCGATWAQNEAKSKRSGE